MSPSNVRSFSASFPNPPSPPPPTVILAPPLLITASVSECSWTERRGGRRDASWTWTSAQTASDRSSYSVCVYYIWGGGGGREGTQKFGLRCSRRLFVSGWRWDGEKQPPPLRQQRLSAAESLTSCERRGRFDVRAGTNPACWRLFVLKFASALS